jgi:hypothetical protein
MSVAQHPWYLGSFWLITRISRFFEQHSTLVLETVSQPYESTWV